MSFSPHLGIGRGGGSPKGLVHDLLMQFFSRCSSKIKVSATHLFDIMTTQDDPPRYAKHVSGCIYVFFTSFGYWVLEGGSPKGWVYNLLMQFFTLGSSKIDVCKNYFFDIVIT